MFQSPTIYLFSKFHSTSLQSPIPPSWLEEVALSLWSLDPPELLCRLQVQDLEMSSEWQYRALRFTASVSLPGILYCLPGTRKTPVYRWRAFPALALAAFLTLPTSHQSRSCSCLQDTYVWMFWQARETLQPECQLLLYKTHISDFSSYPLQQLRGPGV